MTFSQVSSMLLKDVRRRKCSALPHCTVLQENAVYIFSCNYVFGYLWKYKFKPNMISYTCSYEADLENFNKCSFLYTKEKPGTEFSLTFKQQGQETYHICTYTLWYIWMSDTFPDPVIETSNIASIVSLDNLDVDEVYCYYRLISELK